jgi:O-antigen/teichoic acid export membrane protein
LSEASGAELTALAKGGRTNIGGFFLRLLARLPFLWIAAQWYGAAAMGRLAFAIVIVEFAAQLTTLGLKRGLALHLTGDGKDNGAWDAVLIVLLATLIPTALMVIFPEIMFPNSPIKPLDHLLPLAIPAVALSDVMLAALAYRGDVQSTVRARAIIEPWTISIAAAVLWWFVPSDGLLVAYALSMGAALVASIIPFLRSYGLPRNWTPRGRALYALARYNAPLAAADAIEWGSRRIDTLILGVFVSPATVGIYWVAQQVASLPQKLKSSFDPVLGPSITRLLEQGDRKGIASEISQVGFWILAAQAGVALALGIGGEALMALLGPKRDYVGGNGALIVLLIAEAVVAAAVVSEAALVYIARLRNMMISLAIIGVQTVLTIGLVGYAQGLGLPELYQAAGAALALALSLALASLVKSRITSKALGAPVRIWRWPLVLALAAGGAAGILVTRILAALSAPSSATLLIATPLVLVVYGWVVWRWCFTDEDRALLAKRDKAAQPL